MKGDSAMALLPEFSAAVRAEFSFRSKPRDTHQVEEFESGTDDEPLPDVPPNAIDQVGDVDYAPKVRGGSKKKRNSKPRKRRVEHAEASDEEPPPNQDMEAYFEDRAPRVDEDGNDLFCICRRGDLGKWMVGCDGCDEWYHGDCINISKLDEGLIDKYFCPRCQKNGEGTTVWKRKCRLNGCRNPSRDQKQPLSNTDGDVTMKDSEDVQNSDTRSKYCSKEHGLEYFKLKVTQALVSKPYLKSMLISAADVQKFRQIGDVAPEIKGNVSDVETQRLHQMEKEREEIYSAIKRVELKMQCLHSMRDRASRVNANLKSRMEKEICGLDERLNLQDEDLDVLLQSADFMDSLLGSSSDKMCNVPAKKCTRHAGWVSIKSDGYMLEEEILRHDLAKLRGEDKEIRQAAQRRSNE